MSLRSASTEKKNTSRVRLMMAELHELPNSTHYWMLACARLFRVEIKLHFYTNFNSHNVCKLCYFRFVRKICYIFISLTPKYIKITELPVGSSVLIELMDG